MNSFGTQFNQQNKGSMQRPFSAVYPQGIQSNIENVDVQTRNPINSQYFNSQGDTLQRHQSAHTLNKNRSLRPSSSTTNKFMQMPSSPQEMQKPMFNGSQSVKNFHQPQIADAFDPNIAGVPLLRPPSAEDLKIVAPKNIKKDKEKLWEENMQIKYMWSQVQKENIELKTKNMTLMRENQKLYKLLGDVETYLDQKNGKSGTRENLLIVNLKKQVQDLKLQLNQANTEIQKFKRDYKLNNLKELQIELDQTKQECIRLKTLFDQSIRDYAELLSFKDLTDADKYMQMQFSMVNKIKQENEEQKRNFEDQERTLLDKEAKRVEVTKELQEANKKLATKEEKLQQLTEKVKWQDAEIKRLADINTKLEKEAQKINEEDKKLKQAIDKIKMLDNKLSEKEDELKKQQKSAVKAIKDATEKLAAESKEKQKLQEQYNKLKEELDANKIKMNAQLEERNRINLQHQRELNQSNGDIMSIPYAYQNQANEIKDINKKVDQSKPQHTKRLPTVKFEEVEKIGKELNLRCSLKYRNLDEVIKEFLSKLETQSNYITISETVVKLQQSPFNIQKTEIALLVARYLIENNNQNDYVDFHQDQSTNIQVFRSTLRNLIKELRYFEKEEKEKLDDEVTKIINQFYQTIKQGLEQEPHVKDKERFTIEQFEKVNQQLLDPPMTKDQKDYFFLKLFEKAQTVESFKISDIYESFRKIDLNKNTIQKISKYKAQSKNNKPMDNFQMS
ncbi:hypothetical protein TTHERM_00494240 (macronuclear) [Tetrahymena thermophila SB210]|uniref:Uncharacterized protein n=1 Tax=Tetrahymena thermophila (strain SB210) TaxID=312017 RepID=I7M9X0_TETTS|nr:hypothetical protein TTHERM_00494240 [Tetrahymena thermophila SB210]EAS02972.2 hypothetical protein TTHERM_00494240 [Tetrahymena thermophila SB210]|eukprot:XP_001023217.2 hypothetical protein TTHERM_00494240 [Tetrahymena thermophila SB210]